jgi:hypothetical protein
VRSECDDLCGLSVDCVHGMRVDLRGEVDSDDVWWLFHALYINLCFMGRSISTAAAPKTLDRYSVSEKENDNF